MKKYVPTDSPILYLTGLALSTVPPIVAVLSYFPFWRAASDGSTVCGFTLLLILLAGRPLYKHLRAHFASPASYTLWFAVFIAFLALSRIADEVTVIAFVGFVSNLAAAVSFKMSKSKTKDGDGAQ